MKIIPPLENNFSPLVLKMNNSNTYTAVVNMLDGAITTFSFGAEEGYAERVVKFLLWQRGAKSILLNKDAERVGKMYAAEGERSFDYNFFSKAYNCEFNISSSENNKCENILHPIPVSASFEGRRIGVDLGASAIKIWAGVDGNEVINDSVNWQPKQHTDLQYHIEIINSVIEKAKNAIGDADSIGISTAGLVYNNKIIISSLFKNVKNYTSDAVYNIAINNGIKNVAIFNDGDAAAAAAYVFSGMRNVLGLSFGSSLAGGYVNSNGCIEGFINELAFVPIDVSPNAPRDVWSGDKGTGVDYFSVQAVERLARAAGISFEEGANPNKKAKIVSKLLENNDDRAIKIYENIGICLGYAAALFHRFYGMDQIMLMGGITNKRAGEIIKDNAIRVLNEEFKNITVNIFLADEKIRLTGQAKLVAALPKNK